MTRRIAVVAPLSDWVCLLSEALRRSRPCTTPISSSTLAGTGRKHRASLCSTQSMKACWVRCPGRPGRTLTQASRLRAMVSRRGARRHSRRYEITLKAVALMRERIEEMAAAMTLEQGKPIGQARLEILRGCDIIEWDAAEGRRSCGRIIPSEPGMKHMVLRRPIGTVAAFSPWNSPMSSPACKVGGALSAGCSIILKASEETPASAVQIARAFHEAGLPPGYSISCLGCLPKSPSTSSRNMRCA